MTSDYGDLRSKFATLTAENERLKERHRFWIKQSEDRERWLKEKEQQLATLTERLAAATEFCFLGNGRKHVHIERHPYHNSTEWVVSRNESYATLPNNNVRKFESFDEAKQWCIAAGWLPQGENGGGG